MYRSVVSVLLYLAVSVLSLLLIVNLAFIVDIPLPETVPMLWESLIHVIAWTVFVLFGVIPLLIYPFPLITRLWHNGDDLKFIRLLRNAPCAYLNCLFAFFHSVFTLMVVGLPLIFGSIVMIAIYHEGKGSSVEFFVVGAANLVLLALSGRQVLSRILCPFVTVISGRNAFNALSLALEIAKNNTFRLISIILSSTVLFGGLYYILPIQGVELAPLVDGSIVGNTSTIDWGVLLRLLPFVVSTILFLFVLNRAVAKSITERHISHLEWMYDANVSSFTIKKLAQSGYFS